MTCNINIELKSGKLIQMENLISINTQSSVDSSVSSTSDFKAFHLIPSQRLTLVAKETIVSLNSSEIEYVQFYLKG